LSDASAAPIRCSIWITSSSETSSRSASSLGSGENPGFSSSRFSLLSRKKSFRSARERPIRTSR